MKLIDLIGKKIGRWTVKEYKGNSMWLCKCDCGTLKIVNGSTLRNKASLSCGCMRSELIIKRCSKANNWKIDMNTNIAIGTGNNGTEFIIDAEDWVKCKDYCWIAAPIPGKLNHVASGRVGRLHRFLMNPPDDMVVDHINGNPLDNRKCNLRVCTQQQNTMNRKVASNNTSGCAGVRWQPCANKWQANIGYKGKSFYLGLYDTKEEAIKARKEAEKKYFGEYARAE